MLKYSNEDLKKIALEDVHMGGKGRANAVLVTEIENLIKLYRTIPLKNLRKTQHIGEHQFDGNVYAILK